MEEKIRQDLYNKLKREYNDFINKTKKLSKEEIISKSYEKVMKEEFVTMFYPSDEYDIEDIKILNKDKTPLDELYQGWMDWKGETDNSPLNDSVKETITNLKEYQEYIKNKSMER